MLDMRKITFLMLLFWAASLGAQELIFDNSPEREIVLVDKESGLIYYVETGGRNLVCISIESGRILWKKDPLADWNSEDYRIKNPRIGRLRFVRGKNDVLQLEITYSNSYFGVVNPLSGLGYEGGRN